MNAQPSPQPNSYSFTEPTPWRKSMGHVLLCMALCTLTLRFLWLDYLLPAIGMVLSLWGFRALRQENKWFQGCFVLTVLKISVTVPILIGNTTVLPEMLRDTPILFALTVLGTLLPLAEAFCLWRALCAAQCAVNRPPHARAAALLTLWYAFLIILALMQASSLLLVGGFFILYFVLLYRVKRLVTELETAGYAVCPAPVRVSDGQIALALSAVLVLGGGLGYLFGGSVPMDWHAMETSDEHAEIRAHLLELGFPEAVLNDLTPEDLAACDGALRVAVHTAEYPARLNQSPYMDSHDEYTAKELRLTGVGVQLPGEWERWMIFHHFAWLADPAFYGVESLHILPAYYASGWNPDGKPTGQVLYDRDGRTFAAPYYALDNQTTHAQDFFGSVRTAPSIFASFSLPKQSARCRGYVAYPITEIVDTVTVINSYLEYTHQRGWIQYPVAADPAQRGNYWSSDGLFLTIEDQLMFYPYPEKIEMLT